MPKLKGGDIQLYCEFAEKAPRAFNNSPTRLRQILLNLLSNAAKFTAKGEIRVSVELEEPSAEPPGEKTRMLRISVKDTGIGIPKDQQEKIFEAFKQVDTSKAKKYEGTGLGLSITKAFVERMGGKIWVESEEGKGSEFIFTLKLKEIPPVTEKDISPVELDQLKGKSVLVVDDDRSAQHLITTYCQEAGMNVLYKASSAEEALDWLSEQSEITNVILSDMVMPGMDGYEFAKKVRGKVRFKGAKLIAIASRAIPGTAKECQENGFDAFLPKPVIKGDLFRIIRTTLGDRRQKGQIITRHMSEELACKGIKVLVAEDNPTNRKLINILLKNLGCEVDSVSNGKEAVGKLKISQYDVCLMDVWMPVMDGLKATQLIRRDISKKVPIVALTAAAMKEDREKCLASGMNDYVPKPIDVRELRDKILKWGRPEW